MDMLAGLKKQRGIAMLFVTHNLALVRSIADRVQVLQHGRVVEQGFVVDVLENPQQEYTRTLLANTPTLRLGPVWHSGS